MAGSAYFLIIVFSLSVIFSFMLLGQFAHPSADDFCMASGIKQEGLLYHLWNHYFEWSGRYLGNALYAIYPLLFGMFAGMKYLAVILILLLLISCAFFISRLFRLKLFCKPVMLVSLVFVCVYLLGMKHTASSLFWPAGALSYQSANILFLLTLGLLIQLEDLQKLGKSYSTVLLSTIIVIVPGMGSNETNMLSLIAVLTLAFILRLHLGWKKSRPWLLILLVAMVCFGIVFFAPGNTIREATFPLRHNFWRAIGGSLDMGLWVLLGWLFNPLFIIASLLTPFATLRLCSLSTRKFTISKLLMFSLISVTLLIPFVLQFPAWWAMGGWPPPRTVDAIFFVFMVNWFISIAVISIRYNTLLISIIENQQNRTKVLTFFLLGAIIFSLAIFGNFKFQRVQGDLWYRAKPFHEYMLNRYSLINEAVSNQHLSLLIPAYNRDYPRSIYFNDIVPDSRDWRNICYADYFGLQLISRQAKQKTR